MVSMSEDEQPPAGLFASFRRLTDTLVGTVHNRIELLGLELQEEKYWLIATLLWAGASIFLGILAIVSVSITIVWLCPEAARPYALVGLSVLFLVLAAGAITGLRKVLKEKPEPLSGTLTELKKDIQWIRSQD